MIAQYLHSIDLGETSDYTAHLILEEVANVYHVRHAERYRGRSYPDIVRHVVKMLRSVEFYGNSALVVDQTGVGRPVVQMFREALPWMAGQFFPLTITGGQAITRAEASIHVPKRILANTSAALLHQGRVRVAADLTLADVIQKEMKSFRVKYTENGNQTFAAREGQNDDLVLSLAMGLWVGETFSNNEAKVLRVNYA